MATHHPTFTNKPQMTKEMADSDAHTSNQPEGYKSDENVLQSFERTLPENCVEYVLLILGADLEPRQSFSSLEAVRKAAVQLANQLTKDYIWQREGFSLEIKSTDGRFSHVWLLAPFHRRYID